jgi:hypothetical protein
MNTFTRKEDLETGRKNGLFARDGNCWRRRSEMMAGNSLELVAADSNDWS